ncbi:MAG: response regulator transcription factor [Dokdonella sp.]
MRILVVEDDDAISEAVCAALSGSGHAVDAISNGRQAGVALRQHHYDLLVLDLGLPELDGIDLLRSVRGRDDAVPVLVITARESLDERVRALDLGADDYLVKPFALQEFEARVRALLRRRAAGGVPELRLGKLRVDLAGRRVWGTSGEIELTQREFGVLEALIGRIDRVVSREQLIEALCSWDESLTDNGLDIAVHRLRRKLEGGDVDVRTVRGVGYLLADRDAQAERGNGD